MNNKKRKIWKEKDLNKFAKSIYRISYFTYGTEICFNDKSRMMYRNKKKYFTQKVSKDNDQINQAEKLKIFIDFIKNVDNRKEFMEILLTHVLNFKK